MTTSLEKKISQAYATHSFDEVLILCDSLQIISYKTPLEIRLREGQAALQLKDWQRAEKTYRYLGRGSVALKKLSYNQLGWIKAEQKEYKVALQNFKEALKIDPFYTTALHNYELIMKKYQSNPQSPPPLQQKKIEEKMEQNLIAQQSEKREEELTKTPPPEIGRERALQLLDAMRTNEGQGLKLRPKSKNKKKSEKDW